ncbi:hypothetical protein ES692_04715 [Psychroserpens burtonensis]|uniref:Uncharacterized protein n=1 Tax=Psychroserpens burtonensis TaxID=49278 RepID=A0A5C7BBZ0_9FLAO|nr:DUF6090 family protein [Psychroserpens burtonensis]TXE19159.1 hypothetical protein ES692_04715 [Psychroserpens burtonensis]
MEKHKTSKYLKYAIGEIVLVVIGILIALSINNWNQERVSKNKAYSYLNQINNDLSLDLRFYDSMIYDWSEFILVFDKVIKSDLKNDTLITKLGSILTINSDPREFGNSYNNLINSGDIDLIEDKALLTKFHEYYRISCQLYNNVSEYQRTFNIHNIEGPLVQTLVMEEGGSYSLESLKKGIASGNLISMINWQNSSYKTLLKFLKRNQKEAQELQRIIKDLEETKG